MINSLQLLRAIAAFGVVFTHYNFYNLDVGGFGVDVFFILSGFIISYMVQKNTDNFMLKRVLRVSPLYYLATLLIVITSLIKPDLFRNAFVSLETVFKSFFYIPYRINNSGPILSLGWTLNNEMFFYLITFISILFVKNKKYIIPLCLSFLVIFLIIINIFNFNNYIIDFFKNGLLPEFIYGILLYYFWEFSKNNIKKSLKYFYVLLGLVSLVFMIYTDVTGEYKFFHRYIWRGIPALFFVNSFLVLEKNININNKIIKWGIKMGDASYGMYLFHPFIIFFLIRIVYKKFIPVSDIFIVEFFKLIFALYAVSMISGFIYDYIDKPINKFLRKIFLNK